MNSSRKLIRHGKLQKLIQKDPFLTDEQLAKTLKVSVPTVRLDRLALNIPELRERIRMMASTASTRLKAIDQKDIVGELIDLELNRSAISTLTITHDMVLGKTGVGRGYFMFAMADTLALALVDTEFALTAVSNVKYKVPVYPGIGLSTWRNDGRDAVRLAKQILVVRELGLDGFTVFNLDRRAEKALPLLRLGVTR